MASRRRRTNTTPTETTPAEITHEEMVEIATERETEAKVVTDEIAMASGVADTFEAAIAEAEQEEIQELMDAALYDAFEIIQKAEEEKGIENFFEPAPAQQIRPPAVSTGVVPPPPEPKPLLSMREPRYLTRESRSANYRRG